MGNKNVNETLHSNKDNKALYYIDPNRIREREVNRIKNAEQMHKALFGFLH